MAPPRGNIWRVIFTLSAFIAFAATQTSTDPSSATITTDLPVTATDAANPPITTTREADPPETTITMTDSPHTTAVTDEATDDTGTTGIPTDLPQSTDHTTDTLSTTNEPDTTPQTTVVTDAPLPTDEVTDSTVTTIKPTSPLQPTTATNEPGDLPDTPGPNLPTDGIWLLCGSDYMLVEIPLDLLVAEDDYKDLVFADQDITKCGGTEGPSQRNIGRDVAVFNTSLTDCGTEFEESDDEGVYTNRISNRVDVTGPISRQYKVDIPIECSYNRTVRVDSAWYKLEDYTIDTRLSEEGEYKLDLQFFTDNDYLSPIEGFPMVVRLNDDLYFQASSEYSHLDLSIKSCRATLGRNYNEEESFDFIEEWAVSDEEGITEVTCPTSPVIDTLKVKTKAFRFLAGDVNQEIYIHCDLFVCAGNDGNSTCQEACNEGYTSHTSNRRRRAAGYAPPPLPVQRVTRGPIRIARDTQSSLVESDYHGDIQQSTSLLWGVAMFAMGSVVIVLLAALVVTLRKLGTLSSRGGGKKDEEETVGLMGK